MRHQLLLGELRVERTAAIVARDVTRKEAGDCQRLFDDVTLRITNLGADAMAYPGLPQINTPETLGSVAPGPGHLEDLVRAAYDDLAARMRDDYGFTLPEAYRLLGAVGTVRIGQVVPPVYSAIAKIDRRYLVCG